MKNPKIALQMYSLREYDVEDFAGKLKKVKEAGYDGVEFAGFHDIPAETMKKHLDDLGLESMGTHTRFEAMRDTLEAELEYNKILGTKYFIIPFYPTEKREDVDSLLKLINDIAPKVNAAGMKLMYHNHYHEFNGSIDGKSILEYMRDQTTEENFNFEIDMFWTTYADRNPLEVMDDFGLRCKTVHLKDMIDKKDKEMTEIGTGIVDMKGILAKAKAADFDWVVVEQEKFVIDPYESIKISCDNIKKML